jgi:hypothetical protein
MSHSINILNGDLVITGAITLHLERCGLLSNILEFPSFEGYLSRAACSVLVVQPTPAEPIKSLLERLRSGAIDSEASTWPILLIETGTRVNSAVRQLRHRVIHKDAIADMLCDSIAQECARAALRLMQIRAARTAETHPSMRSALHIFLSGSECAHSVRDLAKRSHHHETTLHHYWDRDGFRRATGKSLKEMTDLVLVLKVRTRKTDSQSWKTSAKEVGTTAFHVRTITQRIMHRSPKRVECSQWITLAQSLRSIALSLLPWCVRIPTAPVIVIMAYESLDDENGARNSPGIIQLGRGLASS